jgi:shikimate 5-dehydrogenase
VEAARDVGCREVVDGLEGLVRQGAAAFERWTGVPAPADVMRAAIRS